MWYGWTGVELEVDLSRGNIKKSEGDREMYQTYLGGQGTNARILWDRVPPEVEPFSPDNLLIIGAGVLVGTMVPSANRTTITCRSPITEIHSYSNMGGNFGAELKFAGYDTVIISGKSPSPVYLYINNDRVELRDAPHLWGKDTYETQRIIRQELNNGDAEIMCIGLAGENKVYAASIEHGIGVSASQGGAGAIMGDKKLKAIAVHGTKDINVANYSRLMGLCEPILKRTERVRSQIYDRFGYARVQRYARGVDYGTGGSPLPPELQQKVDSIGKVAQNLMDTTTDRRVACHNCSQRCIRAYACSDGEYSYIKCTSWAAGLRAARIFDMDFAVTFVYWCQKYGLDTKATSHEIAFAINLYEKGILTKEDTGGMHLEFGNNEVALWLLDKIARREGIGDALADGVYRAGQRIGRGAEEFVSHVKKSDQAPSMTTVLLDGGHAGKLAGSVADTFWERADVHDPKEREAYLKSEYYHYPEEFKEYLLTELAPSNAGILSPSFGPNYERNLLFMSHNEETSALADATGLCYYWVGHHPSPPIGSRALIAGLISAVTGMDIDEAGATEIAKRIISQVRAYNVRAGLRRKDDSFPERSFQRNPLTGRSGLDRTLFNKFISKWYELKGWDYEGIPTKETLQKLGLDDVRQDLERRGILALPRVPISAT